MNTSLKHITTQSGLVITILHTCPEYFIVDKPAGLMTHPDGRDTDRETLSDALCAQFPELESIGEKQTLYVDDNEIVIDRPGIVHRLDADTSGVMVIPRTQEMYEYLKSQFQDHITIQKEYRAITYGIPKDGRGCISLPIGRSTGDEAKWATGSRAKEPKREATTYYEVIGQAVLDNGEGKPLVYGLVRAMPKTGRTHQIRVHLASLGASILMDTLYAGQRCFQIPSLGFRRQALHAQSLSFLDLSGERVSYEAPYPADFQKVIDTLSYNQNRYR
jgi:23S rRNA pseudouridine1911/1915/1917 synthase